MQNSGHSQLELFSRGKGAGAAPAALPYTFLSRIWRYEKTILVVIGLITVGIVSFSLGVEKGRHSVMQGNVFQRGSSQRPAAPEHSTVAAAAKPPAAIETPRESATTTGYTIQVASFQTKTLAQKEADFLKSKGHLTLMLSKKGYTVLCVGKFSDKDTARTLLQELKKRYGDCYIRRV